MAEQEKPFICFKTGTSIKIEPRNRTGWLYLSLWMLALVPIVAVFTWLMSRELSTMQNAAYITGFTLVMIAWGIAMSRWMKARSEVVDMEDLLKIKRELDRQKKRGGR